MFLSIFTKLVLFVFGSGSCALRIALSVWRHLGGVLFWQSMYVFSNWKSRPRSKNSYNYEVLLFLMEISLHLLFVFIHSSIPPLPWYVFKHVNPRDRDHSRRHLAPFSLAQTLRNVSPSSIRTYVSSLDRAGHCSCTKTQIRT